MKKLFFAIGILLSTVVNAQKVITIDGDIAWVFQCDTNVIVDQSIDLMSDRSFRKTSITLGKNHMVFDLEKKVMTNDASFKDSITHDSYKLNNITIHNDTVRFYTDAISRGNEKLPYRMYWTIVLNTKLDSEIVWFVSLIKPDDHKVIGQFVKRSMCSINVQ